MGCDDGIAKGIDGNDDIVYLAVPVLALTKDATLFVQQHLLAMLHHVDVRQPQIPLDPVHAHRCGMYLVDIAPQYFGLYEIIVLISRANIRLFLQIGKALTLFLLQIYYRPISTTPIPGVLSTKQYFS